MAFVVKLGRPEGTVTVYQGSLLLSSTFDVIVDLRPDADMTEVHCLIDEELGRVFTAPVTDV